MSCLLPGGGGVRLGQQGALCVREKGSPLIVTRYFPNHMHTEMINQEEEGEPSVSYSWCCRRWTDGAVTCHHLNSEVVQHDARTQVSVLSLTVREGKFYSGSVSWIHGVCCHLQHHLHQVDWRQK